MRKKSIEEYADILELEPPVSRTHSPMPVRERAAQFAPFASLAGFGDLVDEKVRVTDYSAERYAEMEPDP